MATPFSPYANLTVLVEQPEVYAIAGDGNPAAQTNELVMVGYAKRKAAKGGDVFQGGDISRIEYAGFWVLPSAKPQTIQPEQTGKAIVWRVSPGGFGLPVDGWASIAEYQTFVEANLDKIAIDGEFVIAATPPDPFGVEIQTGDRLSGYLYSRVAWGDVV